MSRFVSANLFATLGIPPQIGRTFLPEEEQTGQDRVAILSYGFWQRKYGGNPDVLGKTITLDGRTFDVKSERALRWVKVLAEHPEEWISSTRLSSYDDLLIAERTDKLKRFLPSEVLDLIVSEPREGSRICLGARRP